MTQAELIRDLVEKAGFEMQDIVKTTVYMTDFSEFSQMNEAYRVKTNCYHT